MKVSYLRESFDVESEFLPVRGPYKIEDGVKVVPTPGHSIGHQSVIVKWRGRNITGMIYTPAQGLESIDRLRRIESPYYIYSHDNAQLDLKL